MSNIIKNIKNNKYYYCSFFIPFFIMLVAYIVLKVYPFGERSVLIMDGSNQYVDFFSYYRDVIVNFKSAFYSWSKGLGGDIFSVISYYTISPITIILALFPSEYLTEGILVLTLVKVGLSGLCFSIYLKRSFKRNDISVLIFSCMYALIAYNIAYSLSLMWLDGVIILPLVVLGIEELLKYRKIGLFCFSIIYIFVSNYYIGYMIAIFSFIYFVFYFLYNYKFNECKLFIKRLILFIIVMLILVGVAACIIIPTYFSLKSGKIESDPSLFKMAVNFNILKLIPKLLIGTYDTITTGGLPNIYCGILTFLLIPIYFLNKNENVKHKILNVLLISIIAISFIIRPLDLIWHGFQPPSWFPHRYSFIMSFVLLRLAYISYLNIKSVKPIIIYVTCLLCGLAVYLTLFNCSTKYYLSDKVLASISIAFIALYTISYIFRNKKCSNIILLTIVILELTLNTYLIIKGLDKEFKYVDRSVYTNFKDKYSPIVEYTSANDTSFYRTEKTGGRTNNDNLSLNMRGIGHYSSLYNKSMYFTLGDLGFSQAHYWVIYNGSTIVTDSILSIKYIFSDSKKYNNYEKIKTFDNTNIYENKYFLPIGFMADNKIKDLKVNEKNPFSAQNDLINAMLGNTKEDLFEKLPILQVEYNNVEYNKEKNIYKIINEDKENYIEYTVENNNNLKYVYFDFAMYGKAKVYVNDKFLYDTIDSLNRYIEKLDSDNDNKTMKIKIILESNEEYDFIPLFYQIKEADFQKAVDELRRNVLNVNKYGDDYLDGNIHVDKNGILYTSIPFEKGWELKVDGKKVEPIKLINSFLGVELESGDHKIELRYIPYGFKIGMFISVISLIFLFILISINRQKTNL